MDNSTFKDAKRLLPQEEFITNASVEIISSPKTSRNFEN